MKTPFDLDRQNQNLDSKIVASFERISAVFKLMLWNESKETSLSPIQTQLLIFILFHNPELNKVSYLAEEFNVTKATISDSIAVLIKKNLLVKVSDDSDSRSHTLQLTDEGKEIAQKSSYFTKQFEDSLKGIPHELKENIFFGMIKIIQNLNKKGIVTAPRMCYSCKHYSKNSGGSFCNLMNTNLDFLQIRIDCPEHELK